MNDEHDADKRFSRFLAKRLMHKEAPNFAEGPRVVVTLGPSGSGKSSLLHAAGLLERPSEGEVWGVYPPVFIDGERPGPIAPPPISDVISRLKIEPNDLPSKISATIGPMIAVKA